MEGVNTTNVSSTGALTGDFKPSGTFRGVPYFDCDSETFYNCVNGKEKGKHWMKFLGNTEFSSNIKNWASKNKNKDFMLRNTEEDSFIYARKVF